MQQASFATTALEEQADHPVAPAQQTLQMELDVLRDPQQVAERGAGSWAWCQPCSPAYLRLADGKVLGEPCAGRRRRQRSGCRPAPPGKPAVLEPAGRSTSSVPASSTADPGPGRHGPRLGRTRRLGR